MIRPEYILCAAIITICLVLSAGCTSASEDQPQSDENLISSDNSDSLMQSSLSILQGETVHGIDDLFSMAKYCAGAIEEGDFYEDITRILRENENILTIVYFDSDGIVVAVTPETEGISAGDSLSYQDSVAMMNENKTPILTDLFELKQGGSAAAVYYPAFSGDSYRGFISITFSPEEFFSSYGHELKEEYGFELMVLQTDGVILYDPDEAEAGQPTFNNSAYEDFPGIIEAAEKIVSSWSGECEYSYFATGTDQEVTKKTFWTTVAEGGNEWRIMTIKKIDDEKKQ